LWHNLDILVAFDTINPAVIFQLTGTETGTKSKPILLTRTGTENWPSKRTGIKTGIDITSYRI